MYKKYNKIFNTCDANTLDYSFVVPRSKNIVKLDEIPNESVSYVHLSDTENQTYRYVDNNEQFNEKESNEKESNEKESNEKERERDSNKVSENEKPKAGCSLGSCALNTDLEPLLDPLFNLREVAKQMILLEDHLFQKRRRCMDCIKKHSLTIEGFLEEAITLDKTNTHYALITRILPAFKKTMKFLDEKINNNTVSDSDFSTAAQQIRILRKELCELSYSFC
jgi:hypothetical protein